MSPGVRQVTISPTTRIEGHGKVTITLDEFGEISDAFFQATEIRGFEQFLRGMETDRIPFIISRICGVCSTAHITASVKAIEDAYQVEITETAQRLRELLLMGQVISNHSLVFFFLTLPDFWFGPEKDPSRRNLFQIMREDPEIGRKALELRMIGTRILTKLGGREVHVVSVIPGGLIKPLREEDRTALLKDVDRALGLSKEALTLGKALFETRWEEFKQVAPVKTHYMGMVKEGNLNFCDGELRVIDPSGELIAEFPPRECMDHMEEKVLEWTYAKFAYLKEAGWPKGIMRVSSTARMNVTQDLTTPSAREELQEFRRRFGKPAHETLLFDYARLIELLYACERSKELLEDEEITRQDVRVKVTPKEGIGIGVVEAPRGTLVHRYTLCKDGRARNLSLIIPTQINNAAINISVKNAASEFIKYGEIKPGLLNRIEMVVRAYDPCIKCATRSANVRNVAYIEIRDHRGILIKKLE